MAATVHSAFRTEDQVSPKLVKMRLEAGKTDIAFKTLGDSIDDATGKKQQAQVKKFTNDIEGVGKSSTKTSAEVKVGTKGISNSIGDMERASTPRLMRLKKALKEATDLDPVKFAAQIRIMKAEIRSLEQQAAKSDVGGHFKKWGLEAADLTANIAGGGGSGGGITRAGGGGLRGAFGGLSGSISLFAAAAIAAAPAILGLAGGISALIGSFGAAVGGAGALGIGVFGAMAVGLGGLMSVIKPTMKTIKDAQKAQENYNKAVADYGDQSKQAIAAQKKLDDSFKGHTGLRGFLKDLGAMKGMWSNATKPGQNAFLGVLAEGVATLRKDLPALSGVANGVSKALQGALRPLWTALQGSGFKQFLRTMTHSFSQSIGPFVKGVMGIATGFGNIARAATPYVIRMFEGFARLGEGFGKRTGDIDAVGKKIGGLVSQTKDWMKLFGAMGRLLKDFFGAGAKEGQGFVKSMTDMFNRADMWVKRNPDKIQKFFRDSIQATKDLFKALWAISKVLLQITEALTPLLGMFTSLTALAGNSGLLGPAALLVGAKKLGFLGKAGKAAPAAVGGAELAGGVAASGGRVAGLRTAGAATLGRIFGGGARGVLPGILEAGGAGLGVAAKKFLPFAAAAGGFSAFTTQGSALERAQAALHSMLPGDIVPGVRTSSQAKDAGTKKAMEFMEANPTGAGLNARIRQRELQLQDLGSDNGLEADRPGQGSPIGTLKKLSRWALGGDDDKKKAKELKKELELLEGMRVDVRKAQKLRRQIAEEERRTQQRVGGVKKAESLANLFSHERKAGASTEDAFADTSKQFLRNMSKLKPAGAKALAGAYLDWANQLKKSNPSLVDEVDKLRKDIQGKLDGIKGDALIVGGHVFNSLKDAYTGVSGMMASETEKWRQRNSTALTDIQKQMLVVLKAMGFKDAKGLVAGMETGGSHRRTAYDIAKGPNPDGSRPSTTDFRGNKATGGRIPKTGLGLHDHVIVAPNVLAAPDELIVNRHSEERQNAHNRKTGFPSLGTLVNNETVRHDAPMKQAMTGTRVGGKPSHSSPKATPASRLGHAELASGVAKAASIVLNRFPGLAITSTTGGNHVANSYHYKGQAVDIGGPQKTMDRAAGWIRQTMAKNLTEGIHNPNLAVKFGKVFAGQGPFGSVWAGHRNHIHLAVAGALGKLAGGVLGGPAARIRKPRLPGGGGAYGAAARQGVDIASMAAQSLVDRASAQANVPGGGGDAGGPTGVAGPAPKGQVRSWLSQALRLTGHYSAANLNALYGRAMQESGGDPRSQNNWDSNAKAGIPSKGILQTIDPTFNSYKMKGHNNIWNPVDNSIAAIRYMYGRYGHIVGPGSGGYSRGGRVPWYGKGGDFIARGPQTIGVGDNAHGERVTVRPLNKPQGHPVDGPNGIKWEIHIGTINNYRDGDIEKDVEKAMDKIAKKYAKLGTESAKELL